MALSSAAVLFTVASAFGWALLDLLRRLLAGKLDAMALVAWMTIGALPPLFVWYWVSGGGLPGSGYFLPALGSVGLNVAANFAYFRALQLSPISTTLPMLSFTPAFAALLGAFFLGERLGLRGFLGLVTVVAGALLLTLRPGRGLRGLIDGIVGERGARWMIGVAFLWSATLLLDKQAVAHASAQLHALALNAGVAAGALLAMSVRGGVRRLAHIRGHVPVLVACVLVGAAALGSQLLALATIPLGFLETVKRGIGGALAVVWGRAFYAEPVTPGKLVAVSLMTLGVGLLVL